MRSSSYSKVKFLCKLVIPTSTEQTYIHRIYFKFSSVSWLVKGKQITTYSSFLSIFFPQCGLLSEMLSESIWEWEIIMLEQLITSPFKKALLRFYCSDGTKKWMVKLIQKKIPCNSKQIKTPQITMTQCKSSEYLLSIQ